MKTAFDKIINKVKKAVTDLQNYSFTEFQRKLPSHVNQQLGYDILNKIFMEKNGMSIKDYFGLVKLEKANELQDYYHLTENEVAYQLGYKHPGKLLRWRRM